MKKMIHVKKIIVCLVLLLGAVLRGEARDIYVARDGLSSGDGATKGTAVNYTYLINNILNKTSEDLGNPVNVYFDGDEYTITSTNTTNLISRLESSNLHGKTLNFIGEGTEANPVIFDGGGTNPTFANIHVYDRSSSNAFVFSISNIIFQNFTGTTNSNFISVDQANYNSIVLDKVTIQNCNNTNTSAYLLYLQEEDGSLNISNSSIILNNRGANLIRLTYGSSLFYNNTVSGNSCSQTIAIAMVPAVSAFNVKMFNNTFYNTGNLNLSTTTGTVRFINNIVAGSSLTGSFSGTHCFNNIIGGLYCANGTTGVSSTFSQDFNTTLDITSNAPGQQVHFLQNMANTEHSIAGKGKSYSELGAEIGVYTTKDQLGRPRPSSGGLALGSMEFDNIVVARDPNIYIIKDELSNIPVQSTVEIDLDTLVHIPSDIGLPVTFELISQMSTVGTLSSLIAASKTTFTLATGLTGNATGTFTYRVKKNGTEIATGQITVNYTVLKDTPPGYLPLAEGACFAYMGAVTFTSAYRFRSQLVSGNGTDAGYRMHGFTVPLVADLNADGYPEIVGLSSGTSGHVQIYGRFNGIQIYDGRSGKRTGFLNFPGCDNDSYYYTTTYHTSPSIMALLDSDRDSTVEVIVAFPNETYGSPGSLNSFVLSYNINHSNGTYSLTENWKSSAKYNSDVTTAGEYQKPIPQIADLDGDGTPEVLVYNKIYNAHATEGGTPRAPILTLDDLDGGAYVGADKGATHYGGGSGGDTNIPFSYIYDMDGDGIYDVVAGGKIYKIAKSSGVWGCTAISMSGVADGRTGVADINGDGIADVVTATRTNDTDGSGTVRITVWNPGFKIVDASGNVVDNSSFNATTSPHILAQTTIPLGTDDNGQGNNSYIYIGDIDGLEQEVTETGGNMKKYRLPEIAILGGPYRYAESQQHPNVVNSANPIPTFGNSYAAGTEGVIAGFTWDANPSITNVADRLKLSFILGHADRSVNTGFTMFDFDNDGMQEICYRDEQYLRIIKASRPYIPDSYTGTDVVMFRQTVNSYTGFEYPAIADIDKDASAEMIVMGHENGSGDARGYIYAVGNGTGDKFAPALPVWNQFMYDPFKIKPDLTTYTKAEGLHALDRLSPAFTFRREVKDENNEVVKVIEHYNPFNGTLLQVPYFTFLNSGAGNGFNFEPIVYLTEAYISDNDDPVVTRRPQITGNSGAYYIEVTIGNLTGAETDIPSSIPVAVYKNNQVSKAYKIVAPTPLSALYYWNGTNWNNLFGTNRTVQAGDTVKVRIPLPASEDGESVYIVRLGDNSDLTPTDPIWRWGLNDLTEGTPNPNLGIGIASRQFRDCNWEDQSVKAARNQVLDDTQTVQEFHSVTVNIWDNDILPDTYFANNLSIPHDSMEIIQQPLAGSLTFSGTGIDSRITYNHDGRSVLANAIDSFQYRVSFWDDTRTDQTKKDSVATVYIYVLESATGGFASCGTGITTVTLANKPAGVNFDWYEAKGDTVIGHGLSRTLPELKADSIYQIHPIMPTGNYAHLDFPKAKLTVSSFVKGVEAAVMRWTGRVNHNWKNPDNWVEVKGTYETPVSWAPMECVDVVIPSGATNYPEITDSAWCGNITMKDRAMLKNPHILTYEKASVEIKLTPHEKDSFIMWSAPLKDMYSGDYHFTKSNAPNWGDTYMMFFQMGHPDNTGVVAAASTMTGTVGNPGFALPLGKAFNFRLTATSVNRDSVFTFPKRTASYTGDNNLSYTTQRTDDEGYRFITDVTLGSDTTFDLPVANNVAGANFVQVVNPYLAWLNVGDFLAGNTGKISGSYLSWNGNVNTGIVAIKAFFEGDTLRYWIPSFASSATGGGTTGEIAPLQSFFVKKTTPSAGNPFTVKMSPNWTTTTGPSNPYVLRSSANTAPPLLYVRASQGEKSSSAVLHFDPKAFLNYDDKEDVIQLFYDGTNGSDGIPLTVYTLTPQKEPLAINSSGDFSSIKIPLGLRVRDPGEITLSFSGQSTFLHTVTLIDEELKKETDLRTTSGYTFTVSKAADSKAVSINDRFTLRMRYTGTGVETPEAGQPAWSVSGGNRRIEIQAHTGLIRRLHIYNVTGALVYATNTLSTHFSIPLEAGLYIVRAQVGDAEKAEKVSVR